MTLRPSRALLLLPAALLLAAGAGGEDTVKIIPGDVPDPTCGDGERLDPESGACVVAGCDSDDDCPLEQRCDLITGACVPIEHGGGAGGGGGVDPTCSAGRRRCAAAPASLCQGAVCVAQDYLCTNDIDCADAGGGTCAGGRCAGTLTCATDAECPGGSREQCEGGRWIRSDCPVGGGCSFGNCTLCAPGARRCTEGGTALQYDECDETGASWVAGTCEDAAAVCTNGYCRICTPGTSECLATDLSRTCDPTGESWINDRCTGASRCDETAGAPTAGTCVPTFCAPGEVRCGANPNEREVCDDGGDFFQPEACPAGQACDPQTKACSDPCEAAAAANSYKGCEFWLAALSNSGLSANFQDDYGVVVANTTPASITVTIHSATQQVAQRTIAGNGIEVIRLPWTAFDGTGKQRTAFRLSSTAPVTAYQFNPLISSQASGCSSGFDCPDGFSGEQCLPGGFCSFADFTYTNDASLLLPSHIFAPPGATSSSYVGISSQHVSVDQGISNTELPGSLAIIGTEPNTTVTVSFRGWTVAGGGVGAQARGSVATYTLNDFDVLQFWTAPGGATTTSTLGGQYPVTQYASSMNGTVITSDKPVAVFGGSDCAFVPYDKFACDHLEEQLFPFHTWGTEYVAARSVPLGNGLAPDYWRVTAGLSGTTVTFAPPVTTATGQAIASANLNAGDSVELKTTADFLISANNPVLVSQMFVGQETHGDSVGDPSLVLAPPTAQFRRDYLFLVPTTIAENYVNIVAPQAGVRGPPIVSISSINGSFTVTNWTNVPNSPWKVARQRLCPNGATAPCQPAGVYSITATDPIGLTVYGYDSYVSYGYTGGLDLKQTVFVDPEF